MAMSAMTHLHLPSPPPLLLRPRRSISRIPNAASNGSSSGGDPSPATSTDTTTPSSAPPPKPVGIKNRLRATNQARRVQLDAPPEIVTPEKKKRTKTPQEERQKKGPKKWEEMNLAEKALELYVGEKGLLFWLNKFAYASIFVMVGAWILFRFVGPSLGLYQLDAPPLPPTAVFGG